MKRVWPFLKHHVGPALACFGAALALMQTTLGRRVENLARDEQTRVRARLAATPPDDQLALLAIDETSIRENGRWPWKRDVHGDLMQLVARTRPAVVAWDILFTEPTAADDYLAKAIAENRSVVLGAMSAGDTEDGVTPAEAAATGVRLEPLTRIEGDASRIPTSPAMEVPAGRLGAVALLGFVDTPPGADGVRRTAPMLVRIDDRVFPSLALRTLMAYWGASPADVTVRLGDAIYLRAPLAHRRIPIDASGAYAINYRHGLEGFERYGYTTLWTELARRYVKHQRADLPGLSGRILLVGEVADGLSDFGPTPFSPLSPLVLVQANIIENVLRQDYVRPVQPWLVWLGAFIIGVAGIARFSDRNPIEQAAYAVGVPVAFFCAATLAWVNGSWVVPLIGPVAGFLALQVFMIARRMMAELRAKEQIKGMFGTYVSPEVVDRLVAAGRPPQLGGHAAEITAYFSDIEGFSTFSELLPPDRLVELMNEYLTACTERVQAEGGTLDKYIGDAIVAMFGAPLVLPDHAFRGCLAAVRVQEALARLRERWQAERRWPDLVSRMRTRIGLNTGSCVVGNVGSRARFNYTMMGDNVNLAARMESGANSWGTYTMCTAATRDACEAHAAGQVVFRPLGRIQVKGRAAAVPIFEVAGLRESVQPRMHECIAVFSEGLERYYAGDWEGATERFRRSATLEPGIAGREQGGGTTPSLVYLERLLRLRQDPPSAPWTGVFVMNEK